MSRGRGFSLFTSGLAWLLVAAIVGMAPVAVRAAEQSSAEFDRLDYRLHKIFGTGDYAKALAIAQRMHALQPDHADTLYNIASLHLLLGHEKEAQIWLRKAVETGGLRSRRMERIEGYLAMLERPERESFQKPAQVMATLAFKPGERVADIGAGSGYFTIPIARAVGPTGTVWAIDIEQAMLDHIEARLAENKLDNVRLLLAEADDPGLPPESVDTILMVDTLHYIDDRAAYARKLRAALAPGGRVVIIDYIPKPWSERSWGPLPHNQFPKETIDAEMARAGLKPIKVHDFLTEQYFVQYAAE